MVQWTCPVYNLVGCKSVDLAFSELKCPANVLVEFVS